MRTIEECLAGMQLEQLIDAACRLGVLPEGEFSQSKRFYREKIVQALRNDGPAVRRALTLNTVDEVRELMKAHGQPGEGAQVRYDAVEEDSPADAALDRLCMLGLACAEEDGWQIAPETWAITHYPEAEKARLEAEDELFLAAEGVLLLYGMVEEKRMAVLLRKELADLPGVSLTDLLEAQMGISATYYPEDSAETWFCSSLLEDAEALHRQLCSRAAERLPWRTFTQEEQLMATILHVMGSAALYGRMENWLMAHNVQMEPRDIITAAVLCCQDGEDDAGASLIEEQAGASLDGEGSAAWDELTLDMPRWCLKGWGLRAAMDRFGVDMEAVLDPEEPPALPVRREAPKVGRNDPCPCGSGRKYKACCGKLN